MNLNRNKTRSINNLSRQETFDLISEIFNFYVYLYLAHPNEGDIAKWQRFKYFSHRYKGLSFYIDLNSPHSFQRYSKRL